MTKVRSRIQTIVEDEKAILFEGRKPSSRFKNKLQRTAAKALAAFFALILVFTLVSRASDSFTMARVETDIIKSGVITNRTTLSGTIKPLSEAELYLPEGLTVTEVKVSAGQRVKAGDVIALFNASDAEEQLAKAIDSLRVVELRIENTNVALDAEYDGSAVEAARLALEQAQADYNRLMGRFDTARERLLKDLREAEAALELALGETPEGADNGVTAARVELERALSDYDKLLVKTEESRMAALADLLAAAETLESANSEDLSSVNNVTAARMSLEQANADHERLLEKLALNRERAEEDLAAAEKALKEAEAAYAKTVEKAAEDTLKAAEDAANKAKKDRDSVKEQADDAISKAQSDYDQQVAKDRNDSLAFDSALQAADAANTRYQQAVEWYNQLQSGDADEALLAQAQAAVDAALAACEEAFSKLSGTEAYGESAETARLLDALRKAQNKWRSQTTEAEQTLKDANNDLSDAKTRKDFSDVAAVMSAQNIVDSAVKAVQSQTRALEDLIHSTSDQILSSERSVENARRSLETAVENAGKAYDSAQKSYDDSDRTSQEQLQAAWDKVDAAREKLTAALDNADKTVETARKAFDDNEQSYGDQLLTSERAVQNAKRNLESAEKQVQDGLTNNEKSLRQAEIDMIGYLAEKRGLEKSIAALETAVALNGVLTAESDGTVITAGNKGRTSETSPVATLSDNTGGFRFEAVVAESAAEKLTPGDKGTMTYINEGKQATADAWVTSIGAPDENGRVTVTMSVSNKTYPSGVSAEVTIQSVSDRQNMTLPLTALRTDSDGDYVLILREKKTVLGTEYILVRIPVTVSMRDSELMSVKASLSRDDKVVTGVNKPVSEGDRVRLSN